MANPRPVEVRGQGLNPSCKGGVCSSCSRAGSLSHRAGPGIKPHLCSDPSRCSQILNPLCHGGNAKKMVIILNDSVFGQLIMQPYINNWNTFLCVCVCVCVFYILFLKGVFS